MWGGGRRWGGDGRAGGGSGPERTLQCHSRGHRPGEPSARSQLVAAAARARTRAIVYGANTIHRIKCKTHTVRSGNRTRQTRTFVEQNAIVPTKADAIMHAFCTRTRTQLNSGGVLFLAESNAAHATLLLSSSRRAYTTNDEISRRRSTRHRPNISRL